jgi:DNA polymerase III epsilon subunit-like protein
VSLAYKLGDTSVHELFTPPVPISVDAMATHHITPAMLEGKPAFADSPLAENLQALLNEHILVAHNAPFDIAMLQAEGLTVPRHIDTIRVTRAMDAEGKIPRFSLQYLRYLFGLDVPNAHAHDALGDVLVVEALYNHLLQHHSLEDMVTISQQPALIHRINFGKYKGELLKDVAQKDPRYLRWLLGEKEK